MATRTVLVGGPFAGRVVTLDQPMPTIKMMNPRRAASAMFETNPRAFPERNDPGFMAEVCEYRFTAAVLEGPGVRIECTAFVHSSITDEEMPRCVVGMALALNLVSGR